MLRIRSILLAGLLLLAGAAGCEMRRGAERFGKTFYLGGASNIDAFSSEVPDALRAAGYRGDVEAFIWTISFNPLLDQLLIINAKTRAELLARQIDKYQERYPDNHVDLIALSAGTGVAIWALEDLAPQTRVRNVILLASSLSHDYDVSKALRHVDGRIYVFHSRYDAVLAAVLAVGTIDGKHGVESIGQVGLAIPPGAKDKIVNTAWSERYLRYGWAGGHTDCVNGSFVRHVLAPLIVERPAEPAAVAESPPRGESAVLATH